MKKKTSPELKLLELWSKHVPETIKLQSNTSTNVKKVSNSQHDARVSLNISSTPQDLCKSGTKLRESKTRQIQESKNSMSNSINNSKSPPNNKVSYVIQSPKNLSKAQLQNFFGKKEEIPARQYPIDRNFQYPLHGKGSSPAGSFQSHIKENFGSSSAANIKELERSTAHNHSSTGNLRLEELYKDKKFLQKLKNLKIGTLNSKSMTMSYTTSPKYPGTATPANYRQEVGSSKQEFPSPECRHSPGNLGNYQSPATTTIAEDQLAIYSSSTTNKSNNKNNRTSKSKARQSANTGDYQTLKQQEHHHRKDVSNKTSSSVVLSGCTASSFPGSGDQSGQALREKALNNTNNNSHDIRNGAIYSSVNSNNMNNINNSNSSSGHIMNNSGGIQPGQTPKRKATAMNSSQDEDDHPKGERTFEGLNMNQGKQGVRVFVENPRTSDRLSEARVSNNNARKKKEMKIPDLDVEHQLRDSDEEEEGSKSNKHRKVVSMLSFSPKNNYGNLVVGGSGQNDKMFIDLKKGPLNFLLMKAEISNRRNKEQKSSGGTAATAANGGKNGTSKFIDQSSGRKSHTHTATNISVNNLSSQNLTRNQHKSSLDKGGFEDIQAENMIIYNTIEKYLRQGSKGKFMPVDNLNDVLDMLILKDKPFSQSLRKFKDLLEHVLQGILQEMLRMQEAVLKNKKAIEESELHQQEKQALENQIYKLKKENQKYEMFLTTASSTKNLATTGNEKETAKKKKNPDKPKDYEVVVKENEKLKAVILEMQNALIAMRDKESKLIKLLIGVKNKGIDLDQIFREEVLNDAGGETEKIKGELFNRGESEDCDDEGEMDPKKERAFLKKLNPSGKPEETSENYAYADESVINDSAESSFNYFGKPDLLDESPMNAYGAVLKEIKPPPSRFSKKGLGQKLKLNLSDIKNTKSSGDTSEAGAEGENDEEGKTSEEESSNHKEKIKKSVIDPGEDFLSKMKKKGEAWKKKTQVD